MEHGSAQSVMIVTGEASGDMHGANLVKEMCSLRPDLQLYGMGGKAMREAGVKILCDASAVSVVGVFEVFSQLSEILKAQKLLRSFLKKSRPSLLILIDLPDFNLLLAKYAKKLSIPVYYYITPQIWAWRTGRVKTIASRVDQLGVILPFEEQFFRQHNVRATYVGHPLLDSVKLTLDDEAFRKKYALASDARCIGLFPGSRKKEIRMLLPTFLQSARLLQEKISEKFCFLIPIASTLTKEDILAAGAAHYRDTLDLRFIESDRYELMHSCESVVATSGTVTLELAILKVPMVVCYKFAYLTYLLGKLLVRGVKRFSLPNLIAGKDIVAELLQQQANPERIVAELSPLLKNGTSREKMLMGLEEVRDKLGSSGASRKAAQLAIAMLEQ